MKIDKYKDEAHFDAALPAYKKAWFRLIRSARGRYAAHLDRTVYALVAFIYAHPKAIAEAERFFSLDAEVRRESERQVKKAQDLLKRIPEAMTADVRTKMLASTLLVLQKS